MLRYKKPTLSLDNLLWQSTMHATASSKKSMSMPFHVLQMLRC